MEKKLWFKAKCFGWGWYPVTWQGWAVIIMYLYAIVPFPFTEAEYILSFSETPLHQILRLLILTTFLIIICYEKGETPRWRWGKEE